MQVGSADTPRKTKVRGRVMDNVAIKDPIRVMVSYVDVQSTSFKL